MAEPWGEILYRAAATVAGLVALLALLNFIYNVSEGEPMIPVAALGLAAIRWPIGSAAAAYSMFLEEDRHDTSKA